MVRDRHPEPDWQTEEGNHVKTKKMLAMGAATSAALLALTACSNSTSNQGAQTTPATSASASSSSTQAHNQADVMFAQHMIPHHQQAIEMSDVILGKQGIDGRVVDLAKQIKAAQGPEIQQMQSWLSQWGQPTMPMMPGMEMPGQSATPSQTPDPHHTSTPNQTETTSAMPAPGGMPGMPSQSMMPGMPSQSMTPGGTMMPGMDGMMGMMSAQDMAAL